MEARHSTGCMLNKNMFYDMIITTTIFDHLNSREKVV